MTQRRIAIVVGGSIRVWEDLEVAEAFCLKCTRRPEYFATNDMIQYLDRPITAVTLHTEKLTTWLTERCNSGFPAPTAVYCHDGGEGKIRNPNITHRLNDWGGSVGMFGYVVARDCGHDRVILCGIPMTNDLHFVRKTSWKAVSVFVRAWENKKDKMLPFCRSVSGGVTEKMFGAPTADWVGANVLAMAE